MKKAGEVIANKIGKMITDNYYQKYLPTNGKREWEHLFYAYSKLSRELLESADSYVKRSFKTNLDRKGKCLEPLHIESLSFSEPSHQVVESLPSGTPEKLLLEILMIHQDLEYIARPCLLRMNWVVTNISGTRKTYYVAMNDFKTYRVGKKKHKRPISGSIGYAMNDLKKNISKLGSPLLTTEESKVLSKFIGNLFPAKGNKVSPDQLRNWIAHRDYVLDQKVVTFNLCRGSRGRIQLSGPVFGQYVSTTLSFAEILAYLDMALMMNAMAYFYGESALAQY